MFLMNISLNWFPKRPFLSCIINYVVVPLAMSTLHLHIALHVHTYERTHRRGLDLDLDNTRRRLCRLLPRQEC